MKILLTLFVLLFSSSVVAEEINFIDKLEYKIKNEIEDVKRKFKSGYYARGVLISASFGGAGVIAFALINYTKRRRRDKNK